MRRAWRPERWAWRLERRAWKLTALPLVLHLALAAATASRAEVTVPGERAEPHAIAAWASASSVLASIGCSPHEHNLLAKVERSVPFPSRTVYAFSPPSAATAWSTCATTAGTHEPSLSMYQTRSCKRKGGGALPVRIRLSETVERFCLPFPCTPVSRLRRAVLMRSHEACTRLGKWALRAHKLAYAERIRRRRLHRQPPNLDRQRQC
eukprot:scaffold47917_cov32-Tisochrysis_lutea.AAC.5